jgi:hypothetical protein
MDAVLTGFGQRRMLLNPLINIRQPRMTRSTASAAKRTMECSNFRSLSSQTGKFCAL